VRWLAHWLGLDDGSGRIYLFWSGPGSDLGELAIIGGLVSVARRHRCHVRGCWRIGRHPVDGTVFVVCARHHPQGAPSAADIVRAAP
jgi:hypothetical protein